MTQKTVLIVDDEIGFIESLQDALDFEGFRVLTASSAQEALRILKKEHVDLATVDIMMPPGPSLERQFKETISHRTGVILCRTIKKLFPRVSIICISVVTDRDTIDEIKNLDIRFFHKGEVPLRIVLNEITNRLLGRNITQS